MEIQFKKPQLEDKEVIETYLRQNNHRNCEYTFANIYLWSGFYPVSYAIIQDMVVFLSEGEKISLSFPMGKKENLRAVIEILLEWCKERKLDFVPVVKYV